MPKTVDFTFTPNGVADQPIPLRLYAEGALYSTTTNTLFISDTHFGKADSFRHAGIAVPTQIIDRDLAKISSVIAHSGATKVIILGDFFHTRQSQSENVLSALSAWRQCHINIDVSIVKGNHDLHAGPPPIALNIETVDEPYQLAPFICCHLPQPSAHESGYILAGHLHPYVTMRDRDGSSHRFASFIFGPHQAILPAFGGFTGGSAYRPTQNDRVFLIAEGELIEVSTKIRQPSRRRR